MKWLKGLFGSEQEKQGNVDTDDPVAMAEAMLAETEQILQEGDSLIGQLNDLDSGEIAWVEWFTGLPEDHKRIVEFCGEKGIKATPDNFGDILKKIAAAKA